MVEESDQRRREAIKGEGELSQVEGSGGKWKKAKGTLSDSSGRAAIAGGGERSQVEGSNHRWRGVIAGGGELSLGILPR